MNFFKKPKVAIIIQARMTSTRLPGKILLHLNGKPVLEHVVTRCKASKFVDDVIVAAPASSESLSIRSLVSNLENVAYYEGDELDVLQRYYGAAKEFNADVIVRITSDCPLIDTSILDIMLNNFLTINSMDTNMSLDYYSSGIQRTLPRGLDVEIFTMKTLECCYNEATLEADREHVTRYVYTNPKKFNLLGYEFHYDLSKYRLTLDSKEDFDMFLELFKYFPKNEDIYFWNIIRVLKSYPYIAEINSKVEQKTVL